MIVKTAKSVGHVTKRVECEKCRCAYRYELTREARAVSFIPLLILLLLAGIIPLLFFSPLFFIPILPLGGGWAFGIRFRLFGSPFGNAFRGVAGAQSLGADEAGMAANRRLRKALRDGVEPVACPDCGWYQRDMVGEVRSRLLPWTDWIAIAIFIASQSLTFVLYKRGGIGPYSDLLSVWVICTVAALVAAAGILLMRWLISFKENPNRGFPASRAKYSDAPVATKEAAWAAKMAADTAKLTSPRAMPSRRS